MFKYQQSNQNHIKIGLAGNWVKQSTGYSLQNSFIYSKQLVDCIIKDKHLKRKRKKVILYFRQNFFVIF